MKILLSLLCSFSLFAEVLEVTENNYSSVVEQSQKPVIVDIYAPWCPPCRKMAPIFEEASVRYPDIRFAKIDSDAQPGLSERFNVKRLPTILFFLPGHSEPSMRFTGFLSEQALDDKISKLQKLNIQ